MDGIHDIGGMDGFGPVDRDEAMFHAPWERQVVGLARGVRIASDTVRVVRRPVPGRARAAGRAAGDGLRAPTDVDVKVRDTSAEVRCFVLPERPDGTDDLDDEALADLVSHAQMIGGPGDARARRRRRGGVPSRER